MDDFVNTINRCSSLSLMLSACDRWLFFQSRSIAPNICSLYTIHSLFIYKLTSLETYVITRFIRIEITRAYGYRSC